MTFNDQVHNMEKRGILSPENLKLLNKIAANPDNFDATKHQESTHKPRKVTAKEKAAKRKYDPHDQWKA